MRSLRSLFVILPFFVVACGSDADSSNGTPSGGQDAGADTTVPDDAGGDVAEEASQPETGVPETGVPETGSETAPPEDAAPDATAEQAALASYADALCNLFGTCAPYMLGYLYGDLQSCIDRYVAGGRAAVLPQAPGVGRSPADVLACASAMSSMTCDELYAGARDTACPTIPGTLSEGDDCFSDLQCASGFCDRLGDCGTCKARLALGDECEVANVGCPDDQKCTSPTIADPTTCTATAGEGESCSVTQVCRGNLHCSNGTCEQPGGDGDSCDGSDGACNGLLGLRCSGGTCKPLATLADEGQPCGMQGSSYIPCRGTTYCDSASEVCVAKTGDGTACTTGASNTCMYYASCQNDVCTVDTEPNCP